jgi:hypothetical protein
MPTSPNYFDMLSDKEDHPAVFAKIVAKLPALAMLEAGLTTQASKNKIYVQPSAREAWTSYLNDNP